MDPATGEELEALKAIYGEDMESEALESGITVVRVALSGDEVGASWFSTSIEFALSPQYPHEPPMKISLRHPRGLNENEIEACLATARHTFEESAESDDPKQLLYDAIERVREYLTKRSGLSLPCPICLHGFVADDSVFVTPECSHHFHAYCLAGYIDHARAEQERERALFGRTMNREKADVFYCPVCRTVIDTVALEETVESEDQPKSWLMPESPGNAQIDISSLSNPIERHYKELWEKQKRNGGLIDLQREKDRFLVTEHTRVLSSSRTTE